MTDFLEDLTPECRNKAVADTSDVHQIRISLRATRRGSRFAELGDESAGTRELREVIRRYPATEEEHRARAKLQELGIVP